MLRSSIRDPKGAEYDVRSGSERWPQVCGDEHPYCAGGGADASKLGNIWLTINVGGGPTDDKPEVVASPPRDRNVLSIFLNLRVTDIKRCHDLWTSRGAQFITEPKVHATELRCYVRDPDGYLIEVGQTTMTTGPLDLYV
jgi:hypothetical protein